MPAPRVVVALLAAVMVLGACSSDSPEADPEPTTTSASTSDDGAAPEPPPPAVASEFVEADCWWPTPEDVDAAVEITCGTVEVPSDSADPDSAPFTLAVMRAHGGGDPDAEPVLYLHGGPGGDVLETAPGGMLRLDILDQRDVITFDQRGVGRSMPNLNCPEKELAVLDAVGGAEPWADELQANFDAVDACFERLTGEEGIDLDLFHTPASVQDMEVLRETFGIEQWNVWGVSYGTRLGLDYARTHPDRVRSLLIDSVYPPEVGGVERAKALPGDALDRLVEACAAEQACASSYGDLAEVLEDATAALDADPEELTATVTVDGEEMEREFVLTGTDLRAGMFAALYDTELIPLLPSVLAGVAAGDRSIVPQFIELGIPRLLGLAEGAFYSVECADSGRDLVSADAEAELADVEQDALVAINSAQVFCSHWPVTFGPESFSQQVTADVPTLVFGGTLDPITPFSDSEAQAEAMPDARFVTVPGGGHGVAGNDECTRTARDGFWRDPAAELPACLGDLQATPFVVGG